MEKSKKGIKQGNYEKVKFFAEFGVNRGGAKFGLKMHELRAFSERFVEFKKVFKKVYK